MLSNIAQLNVQSPSSEAVDGGSRVELMIEHNVKWHTTVEGE